MCLLFLLHAPLSLTLPPPRSHPLPHPFLSPHSSPCCHPARPSLSSFFPGCYCPCPARIPARHLGDGGLVARHQLFTSTPLAMAARMVAAVSTRGGSDRPVQTGQFRQGPSPSPLSPLPHLTSLTPSSPIFPPPHLSPPFLPVCCVRTPSAPLPVRSHVPPTKERNRRCAGFAPRRAPPPPTCRRLLFPVPRRRLLLIPVPVPALSPPL